MKLASAERELSKMEALKSELESLKKQLGERDVKIEELEAEIKRLTELLKKSAKSEGKPGKKEPKAPKEEKEAKKEKRYKQDTGPARESPSKPTVAATEGEDKPPPAEKPPEPDEVPSESEDEESEEEAPPPPKVFEDKCVGNGPGKGLQDQPLICKGRGLKQEEELNKTGRVYERNLVEQPTLSLSNTPGLATTLDLDNTLARLKGARGVGVYAGGSSMLGGVQFASTWSSKSTPHLLANTWPEAEPYLTQVWEHNPKGHKAPVKRELIKLGAISPQRSTMQSMDTSLGATNTTNAISSTSPATTTLVSTATVKDVLAAAAS
ncbi:unnamed protein product [Effrenium voratum]|uniref:Uncharacterized protein n=1 Tax=Effrenium voratum TaxID=2562239 RepID=A0AA36N5Y4_9DINO|nr:unnamed protein product [Effrenium voratum]CAJ1419240.1 unnamed protein product [Effrenium voratum]